MRVLCLVLALCFLIGLIGCERVSMPYVMKMDRVDQDLKVGNKGYFKGTPPPPKDRGDLKRPFIAIDVDLIDVEKKEGSEEVK